MSTKIYNAYKFAGGMHELLQHLRDFRPNWHKIQIEQLTAIVRRGACGLVANSKSLESDLQDKIRAQSTSAFPKHTDEFDVRGSAVVYVAKRAIIVQLFMQPIPVAVLIDSRFSDFHYQDQSDPSYVYDEGYNELPESCKKALAAEWSYRKRTWNTIFSNGLDSPAEAGLSYDFCSLMDYYAIAGAVAEKVRAS